MSEKSGQDGAPPGDGSQRDGEWKPPSDGSWLPKKRVDEMVNEARGREQRAADEAARLRSELEAERAERAKQDKADPPRQYSRTELNQLVADGKITQDAADAVWERQVEERATAKATEAATAVVAKREREATVAAQLKEYRELVPVAWETGSKERARVGREYEYLVKNLGYPGNQATEVAALRAAFGDPADIRQARSAGRNGPGESHEEVGGGERPGDGGEDKGDGPPKGLTARQKAYYETGISQGRYKGWKEVREELKFARPR